MKCSKKIISIRLFTGLLLAVMFCGLGRWIPVQAAVPSVTVSKKTIYVGTDYQIKLKNLARKAEVTYKSANRKVAKVSSSGLVTPVAKGKAVVTVTIKQNSKTYTRKITFTVKNPYIAFANKCVKLVQTSDYRMAGKAYGITKPKFTFSSSDGMVVKADASTGMLHARGEGTAEITMKETVSGLSLSCKVTVLKKTAENQLEVYVSTMNLPEQEPYEAPENMTGLTAAQKAMVEKLTDIQKRITLKRSITIQEMSDYYLYKDAL